MNGDMKVGQNWKRFVHMFHNICRAAYIILEIGDICTNVNSFLRYTCN